MNEEELKRLIEKYYNGLSTETEETALREYFTRHNAPQGYEAEKEIFCYYSGLMEVPVPSADFEARLMRAIDAESGTNKFLKIRKLLFPLLSAAAGVLILAGSYFFFIHRIEPEDTYSNPEIAYAETVRILRDVSSRMNNGTNSLKPVGRIHEMRVKILGSINK
jgi:hypothetical protein